MLLQWRNSRATNAQVLSTVTEELRSKVRTAPPLSAAAPRMRLLATTISTKAVGGSAISAWEFENVRLQVAKAQENIET